MSNYILSPVKILFLFCIVSSALADELKPTVVETHTFKVHAEVNYRCYSPYGKPVLDYRNPEPCDGKDDKKILIDAPIKIQIVKEAVPGGYEYAGSFLKEYQFKGRKFTLYFGLQKTNKTPKYILDLTAHDDEHTNRNTRISTKANQIKQLNPINIYYTSSGQPEISYKVSIKPVVVEKHKS